MATNSEVEGSNPARPCSFYLTKSRVEEDRLVKEDKFVHLDSLLLDSFSLLLSLLTGEVA